MPTESIDGRAGERSQVHSDSPRRPVAWMAGLDAAQVEGWALLKLRAKPDRRTEDRGEAARGTSTGPDPARLAWGLLLAAEDADALAEGLRDAERAARLRGYADGLRALVEELATEAQPAAGECARCGDPAGEDGFCPACRVRCAGWTV